MIHSGVAVLAAFQDPSTLNRKRIRFARVYNEPISVWLKDLSEFTKTRVTLKTIPYDEVMKDEPYMAEIFGCQQEIGYYAGEEGPDIVEATDLVSKPFKTWSNWLDGSDWASKLK